MVDRIVSMLHRWVYHGEAETNEEQMEKDSNVQKCKMQKNHEKYIPVKEFSMKHLPKHLQNKETMEMIRLRCDQTVRIGVRKTRPGHYLSPIIYLLGMKDHYTLYGTGLIHRFLTYRSFDGIPCPCKLCQKTKEKQKKHWKIIIRTSENILNNDTDAENSVIDCFFDGLDKEEMHLKAKKLYGICMDNNSKIQDHINKSNTTEIVCVTHDQSLVDLLLDRLRPAFKAVVDYGFNYLPPIPGVIVSHPHGYSKCIAVVNTEYITVPIGGNYKKNKKYVFEEGTRYRSTNMESHNTHSEGAQDSRNNSSPIRLDGSLLEKNTTFIIPDESQFVMQFDKDSPGWWKFPPGTKYFKNDGRELRLDDDIVFRNEMWYPKQCYVTNDIELCPGCGGAALTIDLLGNPFVTYIVHEGMPQISLDEAPEIWSSVTLVQGISDHAFPGTIHFALKIEEVKTTTQSAKDKDIMAMRSEIKFLREEIETIKTAVTDNTKKIEPLDTHQWKCNETLFKHNAKLQMEIISLKKDNKMKNDTINVLKYDLEEMKEEFGRSKRGAQSDHKDNRLDIKSGFQIEDTGKVQEKTGAISEPTKEQQNIEIVRNQMDDVITEPTKEQQNIEIVRNQMDDVITEPTKEQQNIEIVRNQMGDVITEPTKEQQNIEIGRNQMGDVALNVTAPGQGLTELDVDDTNDEDTVSKMDDPVLSLKEFNLQRKQRTEFKEVYNESRFDLVDSSSPERLQTGLHSKIRAYSFVWTDSPYLDKKMGVYQTPVCGKYRFAGWMAQIFRGKIKLYLCENGEGRQELLGVTEKDGIIDVCGKAVMWECEKGVGVWMEVVRVEGEAEMLYCRFTGELLE